MNEEITAVPVEEQINQELVKHNVTEAKIAELKEKYLPLQINGIDDKETYLKVKEARKECKSLRVMAEKLCKLGREEAVRISKLWVAKEKDVTGRIGEVEDHLKKQEDEYEAEVAKEKEERKRRIEEQFIHRNTELTKMGVLYSDGEYKLGEVSFEMAVIKECEPEIWEESVLPKFKSEYEKLQAEELEKERIKQEREAELKRQQDELERQKQEFERQKEELAKAQQQQRDAKIKVRSDQMVKLGLKFDFSDNHYKGYGCFVPTLDIQCHNDEQWDKLVAGCGAHIAKVKAAEEEDKRIAQERKELHEKRFAKILQYSKYVDPEDMKALWIFTEDGFEQMFNSCKQDYESEIEAQKEAERKKIKGGSRYSVLAKFGFEEHDENYLAELSNDDFIILYDGVKSDHDKKQREKWEKEQEEKRKADELKRQQEEQKKQEELAQATDRKKWHDILSQLDKITLHPMQSGQYKKKIASLREMMNEIKAL